MKELQRLNKYFKKYYKHFVLGIIITILSQVFMVMTPEFVGDAINILNDFLADKITSGFAKNELFKLLGYIIGATLLSGFFTFWMRQTLIVMSRHIEFDMKNEIFKQYQSLSLDFFKRNRTGDLMSRISEDVAKVRQYVGPAVMYSLNTVARMGIVLIQMFIISPKLSLYALIPVPILMIGMMKLMKLIKSRSIAYQQNLSNLSSFVQENFSGIRVIKAYNQEKRLSGDYLDLTENSKNIFLKLTIANGLIAPMMIGLIALSNIFVVYIGTKMYINNEISVGVIAQFIMYINILTWPIASLGWISSMVQEAEASQKRINEFLNEKSAITSTLSPVQTPISGAIEFKNVSFTYSDTGIKALENISFQLPKGKTLAVLGSTGSGKSTLLHLITRLYDADQGEVVIDQHNVKDYEIQNLRTAVATVPQDAFLFSDTIKNNIKYGKPTATDKEIIRYAKLADVDKNIEAFTDGYETMLGERGLTLSGGQKQRVSIARALIKQSPILLLDDSLSAVDTETEENILNNLKSITQDTTTVIITHRISAAKHADWIVILEKGRIIEQGTHSQLIKNNGYYAELYEKQL
ncbi:ABC transporter ATP-binding protein [Capnocytophaga sp. ARDL2]|uniref:ABC transporter ATP-binding protein n=1 Tax=Capnocytophaga sp. ARDL2 TaxID=3238809 RepID=UPI003558F949